MAFCRKCGKEIDNEAVICPHCGVPQQNAQQEAKPVDNRKATPIEMIGAILIPILGVILGIVYLVQGKKTAGGAMLVAGMIAWIVSFIILQTIQV